MTPDPDIRAAVEYVRSLVGIKPRLALVLGSGLGALADDLPGAISIPAKDVPGYPRSAVVGHKGRLVFGHLEGCPVLFIQGRVHRYEGHSLETVTFPIRLAAGLGASHILITNAAGGIKAEFVPGTLMWITAHLDWTGPRPWTRDSSRKESSQYDTEWLERLDRKAGDEGISLVKGTYLFTMGPSYETKAEIRAFRSLGADAVGMSTVPEVRAAAEAGMQVIGLSTITNPAAGMSDGPLGHEEVMETGERVRGTLSRLVALIAADLADG